MERALAEAKDGRDKVELERGEMLKGFQEVKMALEVSGRGVERDRGQSQGWLRGRTWSESRGVVVYGADLPLRGWL